MKLVIKVTLVFLSVIGLVFYFFQDKLIPTSNTAATAEAFEVVTPLPAAVSESSGIVALPQRGHFLTHNDAGNKPHLYEINEEGELVQTYKFDLPNVDWEDLTKDDQGHVYIADTGNNNNKRKELAIYKANLKNPGEAAAIRFTYEDQKEFPPSKKDMNFDCEAIFWHGGSLYLVTKDRGQKETSKIYRLPDQPGQYKAELIGSYKINTEVTGAAISPNAATVALVSQERLHLFKNVRKPSEFYKGYYEEIKLPGAGQTEAVTFADDNTLYLTSEGGNLYRYTLE